MPEQSKIRIGPTGLFAAFMFLQLTVLWMGNHAGEGVLLSAAQRENVYYVLQIFVIPGFLSYAAVRRFIRNARTRRVFALCAVAVLLAGSGVLLFAQRTPFYLFAAYVTVFCLGYLGGAVYARMGEAAATGEHIARSMGIGCAAGIALQFFLQLQWGVTPLLPVCMLAALALLTLGLLRPAEEPERAEPPPEPVRPRRLLFAVLIAAALILCTGFYNGYIHHMQVLSGYTDYNVYSWPRLVLIPCYLLFAAIGDRREGRLVPVAALCVGLVTVLNSVLTGFSGTYRLNMCLFYCAIASSVAYYDLTFWRLAQRTGHPALWASMGRVLDSAMVLLSGALHISSLPVAAVQGLNVAGFAAVIVLMTAGGDFNLAAAPAPETAAEAPEPAAPAPLSAEGALERMRDRYALTAREAEVLRELVLTEDKQTAIGERLSIQVKTLQKHVTRLYQKTGATTRSGLTELYHKTLSGAE